MDWELTQIWSMWQQTSAIWHHRRVKWVRSQNHSVVVVRKLNATMEYVEIRILFEIPLYFHVDFPPPFPYFTSHVTSQLFLIDSKPLSFPFNPKWDSGTFQYHLSQ